jgi:hypothetical protein
LRRAEVHEASRPQFIDRRVSEDRPSCDVSRHSGGGLGRERRRDRLRHSSRHCNPRQRRLGQSVKLSSRGPDAERARFAYRSLDEIGRGACVAPCEPDQLPLVEVGKVGSHLKPLGISGVRSDLTVRFVSPLSAAPRRNFVERRSRPKTRAPWENARTQTRCARIRSDFRNRKLRETRPRCRLFKPDASRERLDIRLGPRLFPCLLDRG